jgi:hypothetical protein
MPADEPALRTEVSTGSEVTSEVQAPPAHRLWVFALLAAVVAGISAWGGGEAAQGKFRATLNDLPAADAVMARSTPAMKRLKETTTRRKAVVAYGLLGGLLGLYLGLAGGMSRRSTDAAVKGAVVGLVLGVAAGAGLAQVLTPVYYRMIDRLSEAELLNDMVRGLVVHAGIWGPIGLAAGLALGVGVGGKDRIVSAALGGLLGALIATGIYELVGVSLFPTAGTGQPVAPGSVAARLIAHMMVALLVAAGAVLGARHFQHKGSKTIAHA